LSKVCENCGRAGCRDLGASVPCLSFALSRAREKIAICEREVQAHSAAAKGDALRAEAEAKARAKAEGQAAASAHAATRAAMSDRETIQRLTRQYDDIRASRDALREELGHERGVLDVTERQRQTTGAELAVALDENIALREEVEKARNDRDSWLRAYQERFREFENTIAALREGGKATTPDPERMAQIQAHRACTGEEHDVANGKIHGFCVVCAVPWPCEVAKPRDTTAPNRDVRVCDACPLPMRDLFAVAYNAVSQFRSGTDYKRLTIKLAELGVAVDRYQPLIDAHFAHGTVPEKDRCPSCGASAEKYVLDGRCSSYSCKDRTAWARAFAVPPHFVCRCGETADKHHTFDPRPADEQPCHPCGCIRGTHSSWCPKWPTATNNPGTSGDAS
jgi:hypothetical protein